MEIYGRNPFIGVAQILSDFDPTSLSVEAIMQQVGRLVCFGERDQAKLSGEFARDSKMLALDLTKRGKDTFNSYNAMFWQTLGVLVNFGGTAWFATAAIKGGLKNAQAIMTGTQSVASGFQVPASWASNRDEASREELRTRRDGASSTERLFQEGQTGARQKQDAADQKLSELQRQESEAKRGMNQ